jgi:hypothetical protein
MSEKHVFSRAFITNWDFLCRAVRGVAGGCVPSLSPVCPQFVPSLSPVCPQFVPSLSPNFIPVLAVCTRGLNRFDQWNASVRRNSACYFTTLGAAGGFQPSRLKFPQPPQATLDTWIALKSVRRISRESSQFRFNVA